MIDAKGDKRDCQRQPVSRKMTAPTVINLQPSVFRKANPGYQAGKPCVYVGMTGVDPDVRFDKHKAGSQANRYVQRFGLWLLPEIYAAYNPMSYDAARDMEVELAIDLREGGYGVWQA